MTPLHVLLHPRPLLDPSSYVSKPSTLPSPQIVLHVVGLFVEPPEQFQPDKTPLHVELHPSLFCVPSSHDSGEITLPSPQISEQIDAGLLVGIVSQEYPFNGPVHDELQPKEF